MTSAFLEQLHSRLGSTVSVEPKALDGARADKSGHRSPTKPLAVVTARSVEGVQELLRLASAHRVPVVPRGGNSGLAGGSIGHEGEVVLALDRMDQILEISVDDRIARVQAGVINQTLNEEAKKVGLWFAPDPASRQWSTVGGNIATNAGGLLCAKYGVTRESVLELTVVLADGRIVQMGHRSVKGVTGYDLTNLMIGSEGTLGVIVEATVKLQPLSPHPTWTIRAEFDNLEEATSACQEVIRQGHTPAIMELMDAVSYRYIAQYLGKPHSEGDLTVIVAQTDGANAADESAELRGIFEAGDGRVSLFEQGPDAEKLLQARRSMHPAMEAVGTVLIEDVSVPRSRLREVFQGIREIERQFGIEIPTVAHAADGNLHPNLIYTGEEVPPVVWDAAGALFELALELGGTLTGEHGVGLLKRRWLRDELGDEQWALQKAIKDVFDPLGILNPGKMFTPQL